MVDKPINSILVCGHGLAGQMTLTALSHNLPDNIQIIYLNLKDTQSFDQLYGSSLRPTAYNFHLKLGVTEPNLLQAGKTCFSYGTGYKNWGGKSWIQSFHLPFPIWDKTPFHHYLMQRNERLEPYLISALAAKTGVFAHPPRDAKSPLSNAEYGYHICPDDMTNLLAHKGVPSNVAIINGTLKHITHGKGNKITSIALESGQIISADLYIDCSGPEAKLLSAVGSTTQSLQSHSAFMNNIPIDKLGPPMSIVEAYSFGWQSNTPLNGSVNRLTVFNSGSESDAHMSHGYDPDIHLSFSTGRRQRAWAENCVGIGQAATVQTPLTAVPLMLLHRDIDRLLELIPITDDMDIERREYNQRFDDDCENMCLFQDALFASDGLPTGSFWDEIRNKPKNPKLTRKLTQFESRGYFVSYDFEGFNQEDWTILHFGMGRRSKRYDLKIDQVDQVNTLKRLTSLRTACETIVKKMPPHDNYISNYLNYLEKRNGS